MAVSAFARPGHDNSQELIESRRELMSLRKKKNEYWEHWLHRLEYSRDGSEPFSKDVLVYNAAVRAQNMVMGTRRLYARLQHRILLGGGRCSCTDTDIHTSKEHRGHSLADFQQTAQNGCERCWFISQSIAAFETRLAQRDPGRIEVQIDRHWDAFLQGDFSEITLLADKFMPQRQVLKLRLWNVENGYHMGRKPRHRQPPPTRSDGDACYDRIAEWVDMCVETHPCGSICQARHLPTRMIDVSPENDPGGLRLVLTSTTTADHVRYVALSHCWGDSRTRVKPMPVTTTTTLSQHLDKISWDSLTPTFRDAILIVRRLGLRYLWIDSFCIVQDDASDFAREASRMASVYGQAYFVIAATRGTSGDAGLFHDRPAAKLVSRSGPARIPGTYLYATERINHERLVTTSPIRFDTTPLFERAWCFQERLLATRIVHFWTDEIVFECERELNCECGDVKQWETFKTKRMAVLKGTDLTTRWRHGLWDEVVESYSACKLTHESDRLPALSGFARLLTSPDLGRYCAGLWQSALPSALLWRADRPVPGSTSITRFSDTGDKYCGPSWSWISIRGIVQPYVHMGGDTSYEVLAHVNSVDCTPVSLEDAFGAVKDARLSLSGPAFPVLLHYDIADHVGLDEKRVCGMAPAGITKSQMESLDYGEYGDYFMKSQGYKNRMDDRGRMLLELDAPTPRCPTEALCVAIEKRNSYIDPGRATCLLLKRHPGQTDVYSRIAMAYCHEAWLSLSTPTTVTIV